MNPTCILFITILSGWMLASCGQKDTQSVAIVWKDEKAVGLVIRKVYASDEDLPQLQVRLIKDGERTAVLGEFTHNLSDISFTPVVPLTRSLNYEILEDGIVFGEIEIPASKSAAPEAVAIYPSLDTVPENLLKFYLKFSQPMAEGRSANYVHLLKDGRDTLKGTFLDLQPELWNEDGTVLTLWLDPGRIKLDLIPNNELGSPLEQGANYELVVVSGWRSKEGIAIAESIRKSIHVGPRDDLSPDIQIWKLGLPSAGTREPLIIDFGGPLDRMLAVETFMILDKTRKEVKVEQRLLDADRRLELVPTDSWNTGDYFIVVESRLEDLAGNNLDRLFETDLSKSGERKKQTPVQERAFSTK